MRIFNPTAMIIDVHDWYQRAIERRELLAMDDRMLRDIGITRVDAVRAANERPPATRVVSMPWAIRPRKAPIPRELIEGYVARAHRLRNEAIREAFVTLFRWLRPQPIVRARKLAPVAR
jgi:uncharacterized protein YjiS (DUF1127 family)